MKKISRVAVCILLIMSLMGCGSAKNSYRDEASFGTSQMTTPSVTTNGFYYESDEAKEFVTESELKADTFNDSARKLIKTYNLSVETENYDAMMQATEDRISALGGYIQDMNSYNGSKYSYSSSVRSANITARVPAKYLEDFVEFVGNTANVTKKSVTVEDVTLSYVDSKSKKAAYEIEQERLLALLEKAESIEDMITIEARLSELRYKLESQESVIRTYDNLVDYATVNLSITEVEKYTEPEPEKYWDRVARSFKNGLSNVKEGLSDFFVDFMGALPGLVVFAVFATVVIFIIKFFSKCRKKARTRKTEKRAEALMSSAKETAAKKAEDNAR